MQYLTGVPVNMTTGQTSHRIPKRPELHGSLKQLYCRSDALSLLDKIIIVVLSLALREFTVHTYNDKQLK